jgi:hypothetical protein
MQICIRIDDRIKVDTGDEWIEMRIGHDFEGYYLDGKEISFYPRMVYARLVEDGKEKIKGYEEVFNRLLK